MTDYEVSAEVIDEAKYMLKWHPFTKSRKKARHVEGLLEEISFILWKENEEYV